MTDKVTHIFIWPMTMPERSAWTLGGRDPDGKGWYKLGALDRPTSGMQAANHDQAEQQARDAWAINIKKGADIAAEPIIERFSTVEEARGLVQNLGRGRG